MRQTKIKKYKSWFTSYIRVLTTSPYKEIPLVWSPSGVSEGISSSYDQQVASGRSAPIITYSSTGARTLSFQMLVTSDYLPSGYSSLKAYITDLKSLLYPDYDSSQYIIAPSAQVVLGNITLLGVCTSINVSYMDNRFGINQITTATVDLSFTEVLDSPPGIVTIRAGAENTYTSSSDATGITSEITLTLLGEGKSQSNRLIVTSPYSDAGVLVNPYGVGTVYYFFKTYSGTYSTTSIENLNAQVNLWLNQNKTGATTYIYYGIKVVNESNVDSFIENQTKYRYIKKG